MCAKILLHQRSVTNGEKGFSAAVCIGNRVRYDGSRRRGNAVEHKGLYKDERYCPIAFCNPGGSLVFHLPLHDHDLLSKHANSLRAARNHFFSILKDKMPHNAWFPLVLSAGHNNDHHGLSEKQLDYRNDHVDSTERGRLHDQIRCVHLSRHIQLHSSWAG